MFKKILIILFLFLLCLNTVYAGNNTTDFEPTIINDVNNNSDIVIAEETGHLNINFTDDYKGYCIEYGEYQANKGDKFIKTETSVIGEDMSNYLKIFTLKYYNLLQNEPVKAQHIIWFFTDNFTSRLTDYSIIEDVKDTGRYLRVGDTGTFRLNDTNVLCYDFRVGISQYSNHQDYFLYILWIRNVTVDVNDTLINNTFNEHNNNYTMNMGFNKTYIQLNNKSILKHSKKEVKYIVNNKKTANPLGLIVCTLIIIPITRRMKI